MNAMVFPKILMNAFDIVLVVVEMEVYNAIIFQRCERKTSGMENWLTLSFNAIEACILPTVIFSIFNRHVLAF
jgi:hypothetical protein